MKSEIPPPIPISALQHWLFCPRQCALIHLERLWEENFLTAQGRVLHEKVEGGKTESRPGIRTLRSLQLRSEVHGLFGVSDVVEMHLDARGKWLPFPVEYKRGKPKTHRADEVQLCAQALCLEESFGCQIPSGALFYGETRRRMDVEFDLELRSLTIEAAEAMHALFASGKTPPAVREKKCDACSLLDLCMPGALRHRRSTKAWNDAAFKSEM